MAAAAHFSARIYGRVEGSPPFTTDAGTSGFSRIIDFNYRGIVSFPTDGTSFFPLPNGVVVGGAYVYSVIQVAPSGLNVHGAQYVTDSSVATLATAAG